MSTSASLNRREFSKQLAAGVGGAFLSPALAAVTRAAGAAETPSRPNVVLVMSDQHAYKYCGFMGHPIVRTPNLDRIAREGVVFRNTYCGNPVCAPSRAGMVSGVYPSDCNSFCNATAWDGSLPTWPGLLRDAGYRTFGTGKMDVHGKFDLGFESASNLSNSHWKNPDITGFFRRPLCARPGERKLIDGRSRTARHKDAAVAAATIDFIRQQPKGGPPWTAYCGPHMPHPSFTGLKEYYDYHLARVDRPNVPPGHLEDLHFVYAQLRHFKDIATPIPEERIRRARAAYYAMINELDDYIGQIWDALEETGQLANTKATGNTSTSPGTTGCSSIWRRIRASFRTGLKTRVRKPYCRSFRPSSTRKSIRSKSPSGRFARSESVLIRWRRVSPKTRCWTNSATGWERARRSPCSMPITDAPSSTTTRKRKRVTTHKSLIAVR